MPTNKPLSDLAQSYDWREIFSSYTEGVSFADVAEVISTDEGEADGTNWVGLFLLKDGRFMYTTAGCDYTGWDCQAGGSSLFYKTRHDALINLSTEDVHRLGRDTEWAEAVKAQKQTTLAHDGLGVIDA